MLALASVAGLFTHFAAASATPSAAKRPPGTLQPAAAASADAVALPATKQPVAAQLPGMQPTILPGVVLQDSPLPGIRRELGYMVGADANALAYVTYRPEAPGRYPTVAWFDVYGAGSLPPVGMIRGWLDKGYAFAAASVRGTGCSPGRYLPFNQKFDARDGAVFVEWAARQAWSTGKVGLAGSSQPGILLFGIAAQRPPHLAAIAPGGTVARLYSDGWYMGGISTATFVAHWSQFDQPGASRAGADLRVKLGDQSCAATARRIGPNPLPQMLATRPFDGEYYQQGSPYDLAPHVTIPTLMVQSWSDPAVGSSALWVFERIAAEHKRLFVLNGSHDAYLYSTAQDEVYRWMDHWLKAQDNGVEQGPRVRIDFETQTKPSAAFADIIAATPGWTVAARDWPAPDTTWRSFHLSADGRLEDQSAKAASAASERRYFYPAGTELPGDAVQFAVPPAAWGSLTYRSSPVAADMAIVGSPQLRFYASSERSDTDFMVILHDVSPEGDITYLQRAYLRASRRAVDSARSTSQYAYHPHLKDEPLRPGQVYEFAVSVLPMAYMLRAGHSLELLIAAPSPVPTPGWGLIPLPLPGFNTVYQGAAYDSQLRIPVLPGVTAQLVEPACGSLPFQPCRPHPQLPPDHAPTREK